MADKQKVRGRGASSNYGPRYLPTTREVYDDGWGAEDEEPQALKTTVAIERAKTIVSRNNSPDLPFEQSVSRLRAWMRLLLRAARPCLYGFVAGTRLRKTTVFETERSRTANRGVGA
jgi:hypothetical protein